MRNTRSQMTSRRGNIVLKDVCVSEIVGSIGGCEGAGRILNNARRFLKPAGIMIPSRSATLIAAARLPEAIRSKPRFSISSGYYTEKIFEQLGYPSTFAYA
jgi:hypothetical protein